MMWCLLAFSMYMVVPAANDVSTLPLPAIETHQIIIRIVVIILLLFLLLPAQSGRG